MLKSTLLICTLTFITSVTNIAASCCYPWWPINRNKVIIRTSADHPSRIIPVRPVPNESNDHELPQAELVTLPTLQATPTNQIQSYQPVSTNSVTYCAGYRVPHGCSTAFLVTCVERMHQ